VLLKTSKEFKLPIKLLLHDQVSLKTISPCSAKHHDYNITSKKIVIYVDSGRRSLSVLELDKSNVESLRHIMSIM